MFSTAAVFLEQGWSDPIEQIFQSPPVLMRLANHLHQWQWHIQAVAAPPVSEAEHPRGMLVPSGASLAVLADTRFMDLAQRSFEGGPEGFELRFPFFNGLERAVGIIIHRYV